MQPHLRTAPLAVVLAVIAGVACFTWEAHDLGRSCGYRRGSGLPSFPTLTAFAVLVASPTLIAGVSATFEHRKPRAIAGLMILAAVLSGMAFVVAAFIFAGSRGCFN